MMNHVPKRQLLTVLGLSLIATVSRAARPYVNSIWARWCMDASRDSTEFAVNFNGRQLTAWGVVPCPGAAFYIGEQKGWLRTQLSGGKCTFIHGQIVAFEECDNYRKYPAWEWKDPTGARLKEGHGWNVTVKNGPQNGTVVELRCPYPVGNVWYVRACPGEMDKNPCPKDQCLSAYGYCGTGPDYCNGRSAFNSCPWHHPCREADGSCQACPREQNPVSIGV